MKRRIACLNSENVIVRIVKSEDKNFKEIMEMMERIYNTVIELKDPNAKIGDIVEPTAK